MRFLTIEAVVDSKYNGTVTGLMGNFDGDSNNDFVLPNGTILQAKDVISERKIYNNFGQMCNDFRLFSNPQFLQNFVNMPICIYLVHVLTDKNSECFHS